MNVPVPAPLAEFQIVLEGLPIPIVVRAYRRADNRLLLHQSHYLKTAIQYLPHAVSDFPEESPEAAFERLKSTVLGFYEQALRRGYKPDPSWLVPNTSQLSLG